VPLGNGAPQTIGLGLGLGQQRALVQADDVAVFHDAAAIDDHLVDVVRGPALHQRLDGIAIGAHAEAAHVDQHDVGLGPRRQPAQVVAAQRAGAAQRDGREDVGGGGHREVALDDLAEVGRPPHLADEIARVGVGAEPHVDAGRAVLRERLQRVAAPGEHQRAVGDGGAGAGQDLEIAPGRQRGQVMGGADDAVADDGVGAEQPGVGQVLDRCHRVPAQDLVELEQVLTGVDLDAHAELVGGLAGGAQQGRAAGVDLVGEEHALQAAVVVAGPLADELLGALQPRHPLGLVLLVGEAAVAVHGVLRRLVGRAEIGAQPQLTGDARMGLGGRADVDHGRAAVAEHLRHGEAAADLRVLSRPQRLHALPGAVVVQEAGVEVVAPADVGDQPATGLGVGVAVDVDESRNHELAGGIDAPVDGTSERAAHERDPVVLEHQGAAAQEPMAAGGVGDDVTAVDQGLHGRLLIPRPPASATGTSGARPATRRRTARWPSPTAGSSS
jgi:hypothetical protein